MSTVEITNISILILLIINSLLLVFLLLKNKKNTQNIDVNELKNQIKSSYDSSQLLVKQIGEMLISTMKNYNDSVLNLLTQNRTLDTQQQINLEQKLESILKNNSESMKQATIVLQNGLDRLQQDNERKLEQMRQTVDEKLNVSLERRMSESFKIINERLQSVYEGLGEMRNLASGVGDLKRVLTNVKTRGVWGEVSLENLLEQMLSSEQYRKQFEIKKNGERVDFAIVLPGKDEENIYLPIDAKFPIEDYQRLCEVAEIGDLKEVENCQKAIERVVKEQAKKIHEKYISVPTTTDFAVMYLALEGLYAEVIKRPGLVEQLQNQYKIVVCGPTTLSALLNSLQLGFRTLSIEKRSSEIWKLLGAFKQEFSKFVELLNKTQKKLSEASSSIEFATKKSMTIQRKLKSVADISDSSEDYLKLEESYDEEDN